jgi:hypothetical protein
LSATIKIPIITKREPNILNPLNVSPKKIYEKKEIPTKGNNENIFA